MPIPWLRLLDLALGVTNFAQSRAMSGEEADRDEERGLRHHDAGLADVIASAIRDVLGRDERRWQLMRERAEAERQRAERALKADLLRKAADREAGRQRMIAACALAGWMGSIVAAIWLTGDSTVARVLIGGGMVLQLASIAAAFMVQGTLGDPLDVLAVADDLARKRPIPLGRDIALWLLIVGLALVSIAAVL